LFSSGFQSRIFRPEASPAVSPDGTTIYVTDTDGNSVKAISASTGKVTATIGVGELPWQIVIAANGKAASVADPTRNAVSAVDPRRQPGHRRDQRARRPRHPSP
jgi:YVTN family beta-propeller protein